MNTLSCCGAHFVHGHSVIVWCSFCTWTLCHVVVLILFVNTVMLWCSFCTWTLCHAVVLILHVNTLSCCGASFAYGHSVMLRCSCFCRNTLPCFGACFAHERSVMLWCSFCKWTLCHIVVFILLKALIHHQALSYDRQTMSSPWDSVLCLAGIWRSLFSWELVS